MFLPLELPIQNFWKYVDELNGRDLNLAYPLEIIKFLKRKYYEIGDDEFSTIQSISAILKYPKESDGLQIMELTPNLVKGLNYYFTNRSINDKGNCPSTDELINILLDTDKYFSMVVTLKRELPTILNLLKIGEFKYASICIGSLSNKYGMEIVKLINQYFNSKPVFDLEHNNYKRYFITHNRAYLISKEAYVGIMVFEYYRGMKEDDLPDCIYENYDVMITVDENHRMKPSGSFLQDCKNISRMKRELFLDNEREVEFNDITSLSNGNILEFHDLIRYGYYSDKILSLDVMKKISEIFNHQQWVNSFLLALALCCGKLIKIDDSEDNDNSSKALIDPNKVENFDLFVQAVKYLDSIYDEIIIKPENE